MTDKIQSFDVAQGMFDPDTRALLVKAQSAPASTVKQAIILAQGAFDPDTGALLVAGTFESTDATHRADTDNPHEVTALQTGGIVAITTATDFKSSGATTLYTVPTGKTFFIDSMEVVTTAISGTNSALTTKFGKSTDDDAYQTNTLTTANAVGDRHIYDSPSVGVSAGTIITGSVGTASNAATSHTGYFVLKGYQI